MYPTIPFQRLNGIKVLEGFHELSPTTADLHFVTNAISDSLLILRNKTLGVSVGCGGSKKNIAK